MPVYEYLCPQCGSFDMNRPMSDYQKPADCPSCGASAPKIVAAVPLNIMSGTTRKAHQLNEKSAHEPRVGGGQGGGGQAGHHHHGHVHGPGCGHGSHGSRGTLAMPTASRPWQVGH